MEEKKVPWWRRALSYALDGIRSGFGLFSKSAKEDSQNEPEIVSVQQETPEEAELTKHSPELEPVANPANAKEPVPVSEPVDDRLPREETEPQASEPEGGGDFNPSIEPSESPRALQTAEKLILGTKPQSLVSGHDFSRATNVAKSTWALAPAEFQSAPESNPVLFPQPVLAQEAIAPIEQLPEPAQQPETEAVVEAAAINEPPVEPAPEEPAEESPAPSEAFAEPAPEAEPEPEPEISNEPEAPNAPAELPAIVAAAPADVDVEPAPEHGTDPEPIAEAEAPVEPAAPEEPTLAPVADLIVPAEQIAEPQPATETEPTPEPVIIEEPLPAEDSVPESAASSVELSEPVTEEVTPQTAGQPDAVEEESAGEVTPEAEAIPQAEQVAEKVTEEVPEPVYEPMEVNEPIPEQPDEPAEANEAVPVAEAAASEAVPSEEAPESAAESALPSEQSESEQPEFDQTDVEPVPRVAAPTAVPSIGAAPEPASESAPAAAPEPIPPSPPHKPFIKLESRDNEADLSPFSVIVSQVYDGPLDLLLDLIRKQDIDVYDIPIARITAQFLAYVNQLKATDVDVAGEFIYTASLLIHIKSKMLLPRAPSGQDDPAEDPRRELVERLLEHERFKNAAQMLQQKQMLEAASWTNPGLREFQDDTSAEPEIAADTVDLVRIFRDILERARNRPVINLEEDSVTVGQMIQFLSRRLTMEDKPIALRRLLSHTRSERALIAMFLALLELVRLQAILLRQDRAFSEIFIKKHTGFEAVMNEGAASARDDWR